MGAFANITTNDFILEAFERCGFVGDVLEGVQVQSAIRSLNFMLTQWLNQSVSLWAVEQNMLQITPGQAEYLLPLDTINVLELSVANVPRILGGTAYASEGNAQAAFDANTSGACTQQTVGGWIAYDFGDNPQPIQYIGVQSAQNPSASYDFQIQYSYNAASQADAPYWTTVLDTSLITCPFSQTLWFVNPTAVTARSWRIIETAASSTPFNIQQLYFCLAGANGQTSIMLSSLSRSEYLSIPNKQQIGRPSAFYLSRATQPVLTLWPTPNDTYSVVIYNRMRSMETLQTLLDQAQAPQRLYEAIAAGLTARLAQKYKPELYDQAKALADEAYAIMKSEDRERVPLRIQPSFNRYT